jgi:hypothetical protein
MAGRPRSPYRPGVGTDPPYLGDREPQLRRFREYLAEPGVPHNVLVTGLRGVGKTVLLNHYRDEAESAARAEGFAGADGAEAHPGHGRSYAFPESRPQRLSARPSPIRLSAMPRTSSAKPGRAVIHQAWSRNWRPAAIMAPHSGVGGCGPRPR